MSNQIVRAQMNEVGNFLNHVVKEVDTYLDNHRLAGLLEEQGSKDIEYYRSLLKSLRRLEVICDEAKDTIGVILQSEVFRKTAAERTLYGIYHQCIAEFFSPKGDSWYEDSRAAYTDKNAINFHYEPPKSLKDLMFKLEKPFQEIREELDYYEADYQAEVMKH